MIVPISYVDPLRKQQQKLRRTGISREQFRPAAFRLIEHGQAPCNVARIQGAIQVPDKLWSDLHSSADKQM